MKKLSIIMAGFLLTISLFCQAADSTQTREPFRSEKFETVKKLQTERDIAQRAENLLFPFVGKTIVVVDLLLKYPSDILKPFGMALDRKESLPGLPVARSQGILPTTIDDQETYPTFIVSKKITVFISETVSDEMVDFVTQNLSSWLKIQPEKGDDLIVKKILTFKVEEEVSKDKLNISTIQLGLGLVFLIILVVFIIIFSSGNKKISESMKNINITGLEKSLRFRAEGDAAARGSKYTSQLDLSKKEPLSIKIIEQDSEKDEILDFHFLENLSVETFNALVGEEKIENIAFILSNLSQEYALRFFENFPGNISDLVEVMINSVQKSKSEVELLRKKLFLKYKQKLEEEKLSFNGKKTLIKVINNLPAENSQKLFNKIMEMDSEVGHEISKEVFMLDDILSLADEVIEEIIIGIDHSILVRFLVAIEDQQIRQKIFDNLTIRATSIMHEDMEIIGSLSILEKEQAINDMLSAIRHLMNY